MIKNTLLVAMSATLMTLVGCSSGSSNEPVKQVQSAKEDFKVSDDGYYFVGEDAEPTKPAPKPTTAPKPEEKKPAVTKVASATQQVIESNGMVLFEKVDIWGGGVKTTDATDEKDCAAQCTVTDKCIAFTYATDTHKLPEKHHKCYLKQSVPEKVIFAESYWSGLKYSADRAETLYKEKCVACHAEPDATTSQTGPALNGVVSRKPGSVADFEYSEGFAADVEAWDPGHLMEFIVDPSKFAENTSMPPSGLSNRDALLIIKYIEDNSK